MSSSALPASSPHAAPAGGAGLGDIFGGLWNGAKEAARVALTYWEMKSCAGTVGQRGGLGPLVDRGSSRARRFACT